MNVHGTTALAYWSTSLPVSYSRIEDPQEFFTALGEQAEAEFEERYLQYAGPDPDEENTEDKTRRLRQARERALEEVDAELIRPAPASQGEPYADLDLEMPTQDASRAWALGCSPRWPPRACG